MAELSNEARAAWAAHSKALRALHAAGLAVDRMWHRGDATAARAHFGALRHEAALARLEAERITKEGGDPNWAALRDAQEATCEVLAAEPGEDTDRSLEELQRALDAMQLAPEQPLLGKSSRKVREAAADAAALARARTPLPAAPTAADTLAQWDVVLSLVQVQASAIDGLGEDAAGALRAARLALAEVRARIARRVRP